jgi:hypothetical protein
MIDPSTRFVDIHYHAGVDLYQRRHTTRVAGQRYAEQQGWVVAKSHLGSTAAQAWEARQDGLPVSGSLTLNMISGGLDVRSIEQSTYQHGQDSPMRLVVYLPTLVDSHASTLQRTPFHSRMDVARLGRLRVSDESGRLRPSVHEVLRAARDLPVVIATGHANRAETLLLVDAALALGLDRLLLTHPTHPMCGLSLEDLASLADLPEVYVEVTALDRLLGHQDPLTFANVARSHPRIIYSSDLGQPNQPNVADWLNISQCWFTEAGLTDVEVAKMTMSMPMSLLAN